MDLDGREGYFEGSFTFGPVVTDMAQITEVNIEKYKVYIVDRQYGKLGSAVTEIPADRTGSGSESCCDKYAYTVHVAVALPKNYWRFSVAPVTLLGTELPVGSTSEDILDVELDGLEVPNNFPLRDLSLLLTFSENVQAGAGSLTLETADTLVASMDCGSRLSFIANHALVPILIELASDTIHTLVSSGDCFRNQAGQVLEPISNVGVNNASLLHFRTIVKGSNVADFDTVSPVSLGPATMTPPNGAWVASSASFVIYFSEAVHSGIAPVMILDIGEEGCGCNQVHDANASVTFDPEVPGKVIVRPRTPLRAGREYELAFSAGAFQDGAGNWAPSSREALGLSGIYRVRVAANEPSSLAFAIYPQPGIIGVSRHAKIVLNFNEQVARGTGLIELCHGWSPQNVCISKAAVPPWRTFFLGRKVILNPPDGLLVNGQAYNLSIQSTAIKYFPGLKADSLTGSWSYGFSVEVSAWADRQRPMLVATRADCNGDDTLSDDPLVCDTDGDSMADFVERVTEVQDRDNAALPTTTKFKLYFQDAVVVVPDGQASGATIRSVDPDGRESIRNITLAVGTEAEDCVVTLAPDLLAGNRYTITVRPGVITDLAPFPNSFEGISFDFYTPHAVPSVDVSGGLSDNVPPTTVLVLGFVTAPLLGVFEDVLIEEVTGGGDMQKIAIQDPDRVIFQGLNVIIIPKRYLLAGRTYRLFVPRHSIRFLIRDFTFIFSTRGEDVTKPTVTHAYPTGRFPKHILDTLTPYVLFSKRVYASGSREIYFKEDGQVRYRIRADDNVCGQTDACAVLDSRGRQLFLYPTGRTDDGGAAPWAMAGRSYSIEIEAGAYQGMSQTVAAASASSDLESESTNFTIQVDLLEVVSDVDGPMLISSSPQNGAVGIDPDLTSVLIEFNETIAAGDNSFAVKSWHQAGPFFGLTGPVGPASMSADGSVVILSFDTLVQAGTGSFELYNMADDTLVSSVLAEDASFIGNHVLFNPTRHRRSNDLDYYVDFSLPQMRNKSYYVRSSGANTVLNAGDISMAVPLDTLAQLGGHLTPSDVKIEPIASTLDEYDCMPAVLPDIDLYLNERIVSLSADGTKFVELHSCSGDCGVTGSEVVVWSLPVNGCDAGNACLTVTFDPVKRYKATLHTGNLPAGFLGSASSPLATGVAYHLVLEDGIFVDAAVWVQRTVISICDTYDCPPEYVLKPNASNIMCLAREECLANTSMCCDPVPSSSNSTTGPNGSRRLAGQAVTLTTASTSTFTSSTTRSSTEITMTDTSMTETPTMTWTYSSTTISSTGSATSTSSSTVTTASRFELRSEIMASPLLNFTLHVCGVVYDPFARNALRVYNSAPFASAPLGTRFEVMVFAGALTDVFGNPFGNEAGENPLRISFRQETDPPIFDPQRSSPEPRAPPGETIVALGAENLVLSFSEEVFAGEGFFELRNWMTDALEFQVDVMDLASPSGSEPSFIAGQTLLITPGLLCGQETGCLTDNRKYYLHTSIPGVLRDVAGNPLDPLNTKSTWNFVALSGQDIVPAILFVRQSEYNASSGKLVGYIHWNVRVHESNTNLFIIEDCGTNFSCPNFSYTVEDNGRSVPTCNESLNSSTNHQSNSSASNESINGSVNHTANSATNETTLACRNDTEADGRVANYSITMIPGYYATAGLASTGSIAFEATLPFSAQARRYRVTIPAGSVGNDLNAQFGPANHYSFYLDLGLAPSVPQAPIAFIPSRGSMQVSASIERVMLLYAEVVHLGEGYVRFCLNSDTVFNFEAACEQAMFSDGANATVDIAQAVIDGGYVIIPIDRPFAYGQSIHMVMSEGTLRDSLDRPMAALEPMSYCFTIEDGDSVAPEILYFERPQSASGDIMLVFSEAVQFVGIAAAPVVVLDEGPYPRTFTGTSTSTLTVTQTTVSTSVTSTSTDSTTDATTSLTSDTTSTDIFSVTDTTHSETVTTMATEATPVPTSDTPPVGRLINVSARISGQRVVLSGEWTPGARYSLGLVPTAFTDLSGNVGLPQAALNLTTFVPRSHEERPRVRLLAGRDGGPIGIHEAVFLTFNDVAYASGAGNVTISHSDSLCSPPCLGNASILDVAVSSLPLLRFSGLGGTQQSMVHIHRGMGEALRPNVSYRVHVDHGAFVDAAGNPFDTHEDFFLRPVPLEKDSQAPQLRAVEFLKESLPTAGNTLAVSSVKLHFSEAVSTSSNLFAEGGNVSAVPLGRLAPSTGGQFCAAGGLAPGPSPRSTGTCGFQPASVAVTINAIDNPQLYDDVEPSERTFALMSVNSSIVTVAGLPQLEAGRGYQLVIDPGMFFDFAGNEMGAIVGEDSDLGFVFEAPGPDIAGPEIVLTKPAPGERMVPSSAAIHLTFSTNVRFTSRASGSPSGPFAFYISPIAPAGSPSGTGAVLQMPVASSCYAAAKAVTCIPPQLLQQNTTYSVTYDANAIEDEFGNAASSPAGGVIQAMVFTTIDLDYVPPSLISVSSGETDFVSCNAINSANIDSAQSLAEYIDRHSILTFTFDEAVQAGEGLIVIRQCLPDIGCSCAEGSGAGAVWKSIDIQDHGLNEIFFDGASVHIDAGDFPEGRLLTVAIEADGVFQDLAGNPTLAVGNVVRFGVVSSHSPEPVVIGSEPRNENLGAVSTNLTLYFSEAVQMTGLGVTVTDGSAVTFIPGDNGDPSKGSVTVRGPVVIIDPYRDVSYNATVDVLMNDGVFSSLMGQPLRNTSASFLSFQTPVPSFSRVLSNISSMVAAGWRPSAREGAVMHFIGPDSLLLFSGKGPNNTCLVDTWISSGLEPGLVWEPVEGVFSRAHGRQVPQAAHAPTAVDKHGCLWLLGGECNPYQREVWKTCDTGHSWDAVPLPTVVPFFREIPPTYPETFRGHAIALIGGWQLVIVNAGMDPLGEDGAVWRFVDAEATLVQRILYAPLPFGARRDPSLLAVSNGDLYLLGGHDCDWNDDFCRDESSHIFTDVWLSIDRGESWRCQTANYAPSLWHNGVPEIGRYSSAVLMPDDTIFLLAGHNPSTNQGREEIFSSLPGPLDLDFCSTYMIFPNERYVPSSITISILFGEGISIGSGGVRMVEYDGEFNQTAIAAFIPHAHLADQACDVGCLDPASQSELIISPGILLTPGHKYEIHIPGGFVRDLAGNAFEGLVHEIVVEPEDTSEPYVESLVFPLPGARDIAPWTTVTLRMNEPVVLGTGALRLIADAGRTVEMGVTQAQVSGNTVLFQMFEGDRLTAGQEYRIEVPTGLMRDAAGNNSSASATIGAFSVLSGTRSTYSYRGQNLTFRTAVHENETTNSTSLVSIYPPRNATDVPASPDIALFIYFSNSVDLGTSGFITFVQQSTNLAGTIDLGSPQDVHDYVELLPAVHGVRILVPPNATGGLLLERGASYTATIPAGAFRDDFGYDLDGINTSFTCLAEEMDTTPPTMTMFRLGSERTEAFGFMRRIDLFFSEDVEAGATGVIRLERPSEAGGDFEFRLGDAAPEEDSVWGRIVGPRLSVLLPAALLNTGYPLTLQIRPGALKDRSRVTEDGSLQEGGGNLFPGIAVVFPTERDMDLPMLNMSMVFPPPESENPLITESDSNGTNRTGFEGVEGSFGFGFSLPPSSALFLVFTEDVQAGDGAVILVPTLGVSSPTLRIPVQETKILANRVFIRPRHNLRPGEIYRVHIEPGAFLDLQFNPFPGLDDNYTISTAPFMNFSQVGGTQRHNPSDSMIGQRISVSAAVDLSGTIVIFGGRNAAPPNGSLLNDVWKFETKRDAACASAYVETTGCSERDCVPDGVGGFTLGHEQLVRTVWRRRLVTGRRCEAPDGEPTSVPGDTLTVEDVDCPCPACVELPGEAYGGDPPLPSHIVDPAYLGDFELASAANGSVPLLCEFGHLPTGNFVCAIENRYFGRFVTPYPVCYSIPCVSPPNGTAIEGFGSFHVNRSTDGIDCEQLGNFSAGSPEMPHGGSCAFRCLAGWQAQSNFLCQEGVFTTPACTKQLCDTSVSNGQMTCSHTEVNPHPIAPLGAMCSVLCNDGYTAAETHVHCIASSQDLEATPVFSPAARCIPGACGDFNQTQGARIAYSSAAKTTSHTATATCEEGYSLAPGTSLQLVCGPKLDAADRAEVEWQFQSTGERARAMCAPEGFRSIIHAHGSLTMAMTGARSPLSSLCGDADFENSVAIAVALGLSAMAQERIQVEHISNIRFSFCSGSRRLTSAEQVTVFYTATVEFELGTALKGHLEVPQTSSAFARTFGVALSKSTDMEFMNVVASSLEVVVEFVPPEPGERNELDNTTDQGFMSNDSFSLLRSTSNDGSDFTALIMGLVIGPTSFCLCCCCCICCYLVLARSKRSQYVTAITPLDLKEDPA